MQSNVPLILAAVLAVAGSSAVAAAKSCDELKAEIAARLDARKVTGHALDVVAAGQVGDARVVGRCAGGSRKITYTRK